MICPADAHDEPPQGTHLIPRFRGKGCGRLGGAVINLTLMNMSILEAVARKVGHLEACRKMGDVVDFRKLKVVIWNLKLHLGMSPYRESEIVKNACTLGCTAAIATRKLPRLVELTTNCAGHPPAVYYKHWAKLVKLRACVKDHKDMVINASRYIDTHTEKRIAVHSPLVRFLALTSLA